MPTTLLGKWSIGLNTFFLLAIVLSLTLVLGLKALSFDNHWWDVTAAIAFPASIIALITGVIAVRNYNERSFLVYLSILVSVCTVLFILLHSLFIND